MDIREPPDTPTRAAQKLNLSSPHRRKRHSSGEDEAYFRTDFSGALQRSPPSVPPALLRRIGVREVSTVGKKESKCIGLDRAASEQEGISSDYPPRKKIAKRYPKDIRVG
ncbi:Hypothetical predicted protein [Cloeon dipterum]|uniref:Uncharacterized protein n=1 Tax=Cloeon dipterum TaxID=197152 RepID=A0A8S1CKV4_9INSE|nr:Hypothetical predicted protein [Cloeon dipterum]